MRNLYCLVVATLSAGCLGQETPGAAASRTPDSAEVVQATPAVAAAAIVSAPSQEALSAVRPIVADRVQAYSEEFDSAGRWLGESPSTELYIAKLDTLMEREDVVSDEALVVVWRIYMGEHSGEILTCEIMDRGTRMVALVSQFGSQSPTRWFPTLPVRLARDTGFKADLLTALNAGEKCNW